MKKYLLVSFALFFVVALQARAVPVACCYAGGECAIANGQQQCKNTGGTPAASDTCEPNPCKGVKSAGAGTTSASDIIKEETIGIKDLEVAEPTLLPSSPFYFFKNFTRGILRVFTFDPVRKADLELRFADEKLAETKKLADTSPERADAISRAIENYKQSQEALKNRIESLRETSQNPNVDKLLEKFADRAVKHEKLFAELKEKFDTKELKDKIETAKEKIEESIAEAAKKDDPEKFVRKLENALLESRGSDFKHIRSLEILDRISDKAPVDLKKELSAVRSEFSQRLREDLETFAKKHEKQAPELIKKTLEELPGDKDRRLVILEEIQEKAEKRVKEAIERTRGILEKVFEERGDVAERAEEAIEHAQKKLAELDAEIKKNNEIPRVVSRLAENARSHLTEARRAFDDKKFGEAFGQARSAEVLARNALETLEEQQKPDKEKTKKYESRCEKIEKILKELEVLVENGEINKEVFERKTASVQQELAACLKGKESAATPIVLPASEPQKNVVCIQTYEPVCGVDAKTYSNSCFAKLAGVEIKYQGECVKSSGASTETAPIKVPATVQPAPTTATPAPAEKEPASAAQPTSQTTIPGPISFKVEADDKGFYPQNYLTVTKGTKVSLTFIVRSENVYYGGLDFRSSKFKTETVKPGGSTAVEFTADDALKITSYWPLTDTSKATLTIDIK